MNEETDRMGVVTDVDAESDDVRRKLRAIADLIGVSPSHFEAAKIDCDTVVGHSVYVLSLFHEITDPQLRRACLNILATCALIQERAGRS